MATLCILYTVLYTAVYTVHCTLHYTLLHRQSGWLKCLNYKGTCLILPASTTTVLNYALYNVMNL